MNIKLSEQDRKQQLIALLEQCIAVATGERVSLKSIQQNSYEEYCLLSIGNEERMICVSGDSALGILKDVVSKL